MSTCPRCHSIIISGAEFCHKCGYKFNRGDNIRNIQPPKKLEWHNVSFKYIKDWLYANSSNMILENAKARIRFDETGIFIENYEWYFQDLTIWYRPGNNPTPNQVAYIYRGFSLITPFAQKNVNDFINSQLAYSKKTILDCSRNAYLPGGVLSFCRVVIFN